MNREIFDIDDQDQEPSNTEIDTKSISGADPEPTSAETEEEPSNENKDHILIVPQLALCSKRDREEEEEIIQVIECPNEEPTDLVPVSNPSKGSKKRFYSVRGLLEKVRHKLITTRQFWSRSLSRSRNQSQDRKDDQSQDRKDDGSRRTGSRKKSINSDGKDLLPVPDLTAQSQSSPNTPAQLRKEKRHRSFSPVR